MRAIRWTIFTLTNFRSDYFYAEISFVVFHQHCEHLIPQFIQEYLMDVLSSCDCGVSQHFLPRFYRSIVESGSPHS